MLVDAVAGCGETPDPEKLVYQQHLEAWQAEQKWIWRDKVKRLLTHAHHVAIDTHRLARMSVIKSSSVVLDGDGRQNMQTSLSGCCVNNPWHPHTDTKAVVVCHALILPAQPAAAGHTTQVAKQLCISMFIKMCTEADNYLARFPKNTTRNQTVRTPCGAVHAFRWLDSPRAPVLSCCRTAQASAPRVPTIPVRCTIAPGQPTCSHVHGR